MNMAEVVDAEAGAAKNWPACRDLETLMGDRDMASLDALLEKAPAAKAGGVAGLAAWLGVDPASGLGADDVETRRSAFGKNAFDAKPPTGYLEFLWDASFAAARALFERSTPRPWSFGRVAATRFGETRARRRASTRYAARAGARTAPSSCWRSWRSSRSSCGSSSRRPSACRTATSSRSRSSCPSPSLPTRPRAAPERATSLQERRRSRRCKKSSRVAPRRCIDYSKERMFARLTEELDASNKKFVLRGGKTLELADADIVVGDIVTFNAHNAASIPADGVLVAGSGVKMDEAALNGEPEPAEKTVSEAPWILSGTVCTSGSGKLLVLAVGTHSVSGKIKAAVYGEEAEDDEGGSPLFDKLDKMSLQIGKAGMFVSILVFCVMFVFGVLVKKGPAKEIVHYVVQAITILAVAVPEGLPLAVTLSLAFSSSKMMADNNLVKTLKACETMGSATTICSDKTGTLTANRMTVRGAIVAGELVPALDPRTGGPEALKPVGERVVSSSVPKAAVAELGKLISVDTMDESSVEPPEVAGGKPVFKGNPTECALLELASGLGADWRSLRDSTPGRSEATSGDGHPFMFSSARKLMSWAVPKSGGGFRVYVKGAAEIVLARCVSEIKGESLKPEPLDEKRRTDVYINGVVKTFAADAMRTIAMAYPRPRRNLPSRDPVLRRKIHVAGRGAAVLRRKIHVADRGAAVLRRKIHVAAAAPPCLRRKIHVADRGAAATFIRGIRLAGTATSTSRPRAAGPRVPRRSRTRTARTRTSRRRSSRCSRSWASRIRCETRCRPRSRGATAPASTSGCARATTSRRPSPSRRAAAFYGMSTTSTSRPRAT